MVSLLNRKPVSDTPVYVEGMPYRILSKPNRRAHPMELQYVEAVDPFGNQVILQKSGDVYRMWDRTYLPKVSLESMRRANPRMADALDTDYEGSEARFPGGMKVNEERKFLLDEPRYQRISDWKKVDENFRLVNAYNYVVTTDRAEWMRQSMERDGAVEEIDDPETDTHGFRESRYVRNGNQWEVVEFVQTSNASDWFAKPPEPPTVKGGKGSGKAPARKAPAKGAPGRTAARSRKPKTKGGRA